MRRDAGTTIPVLLLVIYFCSGVSALTLQVVWFKQLQFVLGSSTLSVSVTVASFFFGLSMGSLIGGRFAERLGHPLRLYAALEALLAAIAIGVTLFLRSWPSWIAMFGSLLGPGRATAVPLSIAVAFAALLPATLLMGATLPVVAHWMVDQPTRIATRIGHLYAVNTFGAAVGCALVGYLGIEILGVTGSALAAAGLDLLIGLAALGLSSESGQRRAVTGADPHTSLAVNHPGVLGAVFAASGFVAIAYEVLWFRVLSNYSDQSVYAFSGMLTVYLLGLVGGTLVCTRWLARRKELLLRTFAGAQLLLAMLAMVSVAVLGRARNVLQLVPPLPNGLVMWLGASPSFLLLCVVVVLPSTVLLGITFPVASELTNRGLRGLSVRLGALYSANTLGGVLGSLVTGFLLLPRLGSFASFVLMSALNILLAGVTVVSQSSLRRNTKSLRQVVLAVIVVGAGYGILGTQWLRSALSNFTGATVMAFSETRDATLTVLAYPDYGTYQQLMVNGNSYANNRPEGRRYMASMAHLPMLLHPDPRRALLICVGTGTTAGALTTWGQLEQITAVDLLPEVFQFAPYFNPHINHRFYADPRVHTVVADGRHFLLTTGQKWDVVTLEPPPPDNAGIVNLYSEDFYSVVKQHLAPGGNLAQWVPVDFARGEVWRRLMRALMHSFNHVSLWVTNRMEGIAIASDHPLAIDVGGLTTRMQTPGVRQDLDDIGITSAAHLLGTFVAADSALEGLVGAGVGVTDDHPTIEYHNLIPVGPVTSDDLIGGSEPVSQELVGAYDPAQLAAARRAVEAIWRAHQAQTRGDAVAAEAWVAKGLALDPDNQYLQFLRLVTAGQ
jgi:spermidine synthase